MRILCLWLELRDWPKVFESCLPLRRQGDRPVLTKRQRREQRAQERQAFD